MFDLFIAFLLGIAVTGIAVFCYQGNIIMNKPTLWARLKAWWPLFVKRHIEDEDPTPFDPQSPTRYVPEQYIDWNHPEVPKWAVCCAIDNNDRDRGKVVFFGEDDIKIDKGSYWEPSMLGCFYWAYGFSACITGPLPPWKESLRKRPE